MPTVLGVSPAPMMNKSHSLFHLLNIPLLLSKEMPEFAQLPVQQQFPYDDPEDYNGQFDEEEEEDVADVADVPGVTGNRNQGEP